MVTKKGGDNGAAKSMMEYLGSPDGQNAYAKLDPSNVATNLKADFSQLNAIQKKAQQVIADAKYISQFLDRDALPAFASTVMIPALQTFTQERQVRHGKRREAGQVSVQRTVRRTRDRSPHARSCPQAPPRLRRPPRRRSRRPRDADVGCSG